MHRSFALPFPLSCSLFSRRRRWPAALLAVSLASLAACGPGGADEADAALDAQALSSVPATASRAVCAAARPGAARCHALVRTGQPGFDAATGKPKGLTPADLAAAYELPKSGGAGTTVALVDAYDAPAVESDLAVYRKQFGLPACTSANGCFRKVGQSGKSTSLPASDEGWAQEISLDVEMVSAACPACTILLVEADSDSMEDLGAAENSAVKLGAKIVANSWGGAESSGDDAWDTNHFKHAGVLITASSGDDGYGVEFPAASPHVLAVGGTKLARSSASRGWSESAWSGGGSGCSAFAAKPSWQHDSGCARRTVADVSAVADPDTGVAVYTSAGDAGGWNVFGGTSVAAPLVAAIFAVTGHAGASPQLAYAHASAFHDLKSGSNGSCAASAAYLCAAHSGYDGPTGLGSPDGKSLAAVAGSGD